LNTRLYVALLLFCPFVVFGQGRSRLPYTQNELEAIASHFKLREMSGAEANATGFLEQVEQQQLIHLATHAEVDAENPLNSELLFSEKEGQNTSVKVNELYNLDLQSELAVLSACNTGVGMQAKGIGNMSIAHAFAVAGCPSIVLTEWQVDDAATSEVMKVFYRELADEKPIHEALRQAKLEYLATSQKVRAAPYYWAGVNAWGNTTALQYKDQRPWGYYLPGGILIGLLFFIGYRVVSRS